MYIPSHLKYYSEKRFQERYKKEIVKEFSDALKVFNLNFNDFAKKLNLLERAIFFKIGFIFSYYIKNIRCQRCLHQTTQLRFLSFIAVIEALLGNAKKKIVKSNGKPFEEPLVVTFLTNNLLPNEQNEISKMILIKKGNREVKSLLYKFKWLVDMRNGFMHRAELIRIEGISIRRLHRGRSGGTVFINSDLNNKLFFDEIIAFVKILIVRYLLTPDNKRKPIMNHRIVKAGRSI